MAGRQRERSEPGDYCHRRRLWAYRWEWIGCEGLEQARITMTYRVGSEVIGHIGAIIIPHQNRHIILNRNIIRKHIHIPMIPIYH
jgi:hypothetical protein